MNLYIKVVNLSKKIDGWYSCKAFFKDYRDFLSLNLAIAPRSANSAFWYALRVFSAIDSSGNLSDVDDLRSCFVIALWMVAVVSAFFQFSVERFCR